MSHITEFYVEGLAGNEKGFGGPLNRDTNIFFGLNGSGKTSLLKIFHSAFLSNASLLDHVTFTKAMVAIESLHYKQIFRYTIERNVKRRRKSTASANRANPENAASEIEIEFDVVPRSRSSRLPIGWKIEPKLPDDSAGRWSHRYLATSRLFPRIASISSDEINEDLYDKMFVNELERHWVEFFGGVQAEVLNLQEQGIANILSEVLSTSNLPIGEKPVDWERAYKRATAFLKRQKISLKLPDKKAFQARFQENPILRKVVERIDSLEEQIAKATEPRTKLQNLIGRLFSGNKSISFGDTKVEVISKKGAPIQLQSLSSGEKQILGILFEVLNSNESTLIIDEPELSLHIDWQRELINAIKELNPALQLIVATHSPEIMAEIPDSKIFKIPE